jgi:hypothetical protein
MQRSTDQGRAARAIRIGLLCAAFTLGLFMIVPAAGAVTIGQLAPGTPTATCTGLADFGGGNGTNGSSYTVPAGGTTITSWSTNAAPGANPSLKFKVFRLVAGLDFKVVAHDGPRPLSGGTVNTFSGLSIPVQPGDLIGLNSADASLAIPSACIFGTPGGLLYVQAGDVADGSSGTFAPANDFSPNVTAEVSFVTGQRAAALNKCRKKHKKNHNKKKFKKCKKKANLLPV